MTLNRKLALATGVFFIIATIMGVVNAGMIGPIIADDNYLTAMANNTDLVLYAVIINLVMAGSVMVVAVVIYPILKQVNELMAVGYLTARIFEGIVLALAGLIWAILVPLSQKFIDMGMPADSYFQTLGDILVSLSTTGFALGASIIFGVTAIILNVALFRYKLVPIFISLWGFVGGVLILILGVMSILGMSISSIEIAFTAPIALNEMVLAVWLIAKGFNTENLK